MEDTHAQDSLSDSIVSDLDSKEALRNTAEIAAEGLGLIGRPDEIDTLVEMQQQHIPLTETNYRNFRQQQEDNYRNNREANERELLLTYEQEGFPEPVNPNQEVIDDTLPFLQTAEGEVRGFATPEGSLYFDRTVMSPEHPVHEYTHLWDRVVAKNNPELWHRGIALMKQISLWKDIENDENYGKKWKGIENMTPKKLESLIASEVHSRLAGVNGEQILDRLSKEKGQKGIISRLKQWLLDFWKDLKGTFSNWSQEDLDKLTLQDFTMMTIRDFADGFNPNTFQQASAEQAEISQQSIPASYEGMITPDANTIFVFGSNPEGRHGAGAAKTAKEKFGAVYGQGEGLQGNAYALPTKDLRSKPLYSEDGGKTPVTMYRGYALTEDREAYNIEETVGKTAVDYDESLKGALYFTNSEEEAQDYAKGRTDKSPEPPTQENPQERPVNRHYTGDYAKVSKYHIAANAKVEHYADMKDYVRNGKNSTADVIVLDKGTMWTENKEYIVKNPNVLVYQNMKRSIAPEQITESIRKMYEVARQNPSKQFKVAYTNGLNETTLNGYTGAEMIKMFKDAGPIPSNVVFNKEWTDHWNEVQTSKQQVKGDNIASGSRGTSELAKKLTNKYNDVSVEYKGTLFKNSEHAYQTWKSGKFDQSGFDANGERGKLPADRATNYQTMVDIITAKLQQHPDLVQGITERGGMDYLNASTHNVLGKKGDYWETSGQNKFMEALKEAYNKVLQDVQEQKKVVSNLEDSLGGGEQATAEIQDAVKVAKKGLSFEEALAGQETFFSKEEQAQIKQGLNGKNLQVMSVSRLTDPAFFSKEIISFLEKNAEKPLNDPTRVTAIEIWS
jgi:hypothetical protein